MTGFVTGADELTRISSFLRGLEDVTSSRRVSSPLGTALYHEDFALRWDSNFLRLEGESDTVSASEVAAECDRLFEGFTHREVVVEDVVRGAALAMGFGELGWEVDRLVLMARHRPPDREIDMSSAAEVELGEIEAAIHKVNLAAHPGTTDEESSMLTGFRRVLLERAGARFFAARVDGEVAAYCERYLLDGVAQIEDVNTLERFRGRGLAQAVVSLAASAAVGAGADLVFLMADADDWPRELYAKLGFDPLGHRWQFTRPPEGRNRPS